MCGKAGMMPRGVKKSLREVIKGYVGSDLKMLEYYADMERNSRIIEETWA